MKLKVRFKEQGSKQNVQFVDNSQRIDFTVKDGQTVTKVDIPHYLDPYAVTPMVYEQTLSTKWKYMVDDVVIRAMPTPVTVSQDNVTNILSIS